MPLKVGTVSTVSTVSTVNTVSTVIPLKVGARTLKQTPQDN